MKTFERPFAWLVPGLALGLALFLPVLDSQGRVLFCYWLILAGMSLSWAAAWQWPQTKWLGRLALALALAGIALWGADLVLGLADKLMRVWSCQLFSPFINEIMEGREAVKCWWLTQGGAIYSPLKDYPYFITLYGPVYYLVGAWFTAWFGPGMFAARLVSALAGVGLALALTALVARRSGMALFGVGAALFMILSPTMAYAMHARPDVLAWLLLMVGTLCLNRALETPTANNQAIWAAAVFFALAAFTKQQTWAFEAGAVLYCWWLKPYRGLAWRLSLTLLLLAGAGLVLTQWATHGEFTRQSILYPQRMSALGSYNSWAVAGVRGWQFLQGHWGLTLIYALAIWARRKGPWLATDAMLALGLVTTVLSVRWWGASFNHFMGPAIFLALESFVFLAGLAKSGRLAALAWGLGLILVPVFHTPSLPGLDDPCRNQALAGQADLVRQKLETIPGPVIMDAEGAYLFLGSSIYPKLRLYDAFETGIYDQTGQWTLLDSGLARDIRGRKASAFVDSQVFMSEKLADLVRIYYRLEEKIGGYAFYLPRRDMAILAFPGLEAPLVRDGLASLNLAEANGLKSWGKYLQPVDPNVGGVLTLKITSQAPLGQVLLGLNPRFTEQGQALDLAWSPDGINFTALAHWAYQGPPPGTGWENRQEAHLRVDGRQAFIRLTLSGSAQLWQDTAKPLTFHLSGEKEPKSADTGLTGGGSTNSTQP